MLLRAGRMAFQNIRIILCLGNPSAPWAALSTQMLMPSRAAAPVLPLPLPWTFPFIDVMAVWTLDYFTELSNSKPQTWFYFHLLTNPLIFIHFDPPLLEASPHGQCPEDSLLNTFPRFWGHLHGSVREVSDSWFWLKS